MAKIVNVVYMKPFVNTNRYQIINTDVGVWMHVLDTVTQRKYVIQDFEGPEDWIKMSKFGDFQWEQFFSKEENVEWKS